MSEWRQLIRDVLVRHDGVYTDPGIPARKLATARATCRVPDDEHVIGLLDRTVFGSAKLAVVFGERAVYIRDRWTDNAPDGVVVLELHGLAQLLSLPYYTPAIPSPILHSIGDLRRAIDATSAVRLDAALVVPAMHAPGDVGGTPEAIALQAAIASTPDDDGPQLVLADLLLAADDPRGELIVLHQRETTEGLRDPEALERYLLLGALYSFPRATPEEPVLPFIGSFTTPVRYAVTHADRRYDVHYHSGRLELRVDGRLVLQRKLALAARDSWTASEAALLLRHLSDAIRAGTPLIGLQFPFGKDPLPSYGGGPVRGYRVPEEFTRPRGLGPNELGLAARDYLHWIAVWRRLARRRDSSSFADV